MNNKSTKMTYEKAEGMDLELLARKLKIYTENKKQIADLADGSINQFYLAYLGNHIHGKLQDDLERDLN